MKSITIEKPNDDFITICKPKVDELIKEINAVFKTHDLPVNAVIVYENGYAYFRLDPKKEKEVKEQIKKTAQYLHRTPGAVLKFRSA